MTTLSRYIRTQTVIGAVINMLIGSVFFMVLFGQSTDVPLWGTRGLVLDCVPQGFLAGLASVLPPSLITRAGMAKDKMPVLHGTPPRLPRGLLLRCLMLAVLSMIGVAGSAAILALASGAETLPFWPAFAGKVAVGGVLAFILTPVALRSLLVRPL